LTHAVQLTIDRDHDGGALDHLYQSVEQAFVVVMCQLEMFVQDALDIADGLNGQFLVIY
jgi:hypothetical protein